MIELSVIRDLIAIFGVIAGFSYYVLTVRANQKKQELALKAQQQSANARQAQLHLHIYDSMVSSDFIEKWWRLGQLEWETFDEFIEKYGPEKDLAVFSDFIAIGNYLENIGLLLKRGHIDKGYVDDLVSGDIISFWNCWKPVIEGMREKWNWPQFNEHVEYLYNEIAPLVKEQHPGVEKTLDRSLFNQKDPNTQN